MTTSRQSIPLSQRTLFDLAAQIGASQIVEAIKEIPDTGKFLGFTLAVALAEKKLAEMQISSRQSAMSEASKAGVPTHVVKSLMISKDFRNLDVEIYDQADLLE